MDEEKSLMAVDRRSPFETIFMRKGTAQPFVLQSKNKRKVNLNIYTRGKAGAGWAVLAKIRMQVYYGPGIVNMK